MARKKVVRRKKVEPRSRGLSPREVASERAPAPIQSLAAQVEEDGASVLATYREPLAGHWQLFVAVPIDKVAPTPFQRDLSEAHLKRLTKRIDEVGRFLDPIIAVRRPDGTYWTPNGNHRLNALRELGAQTVVALLVPEERVAYQILALNTEKSHNLREKALEVIRMARDLAVFDDAPERDHELVFEEPAFLTLGLCYEKNGRFSGGTYQPVLKRLESFLPQKLPKAIEIREARAAQLMVLDEAVAAAVAGLKARGFESPYLKSFVVARINPIRFRPDAEADFDEVIGKMTAAAKKFDAGKVKADQIARSGGPPEAAE
ncbi:MAG: ParB N-terminal domain-containing protein [Planctomycetota bacterium]|nr:ParB N-terminal domain-containing protein [Planctomycetota bacterium]